MLAKGALWVDYIEMNSKHPDETIEITPLFWESIPYQTAM